MASAIAVNNSAASAPNATPVQRCRGPALMRVATRPPITAPRRNATTAVPDRGADNPFPPAAANPRNTTFPVIFAVNTCPSARQLTASTRPVTTVSPSSRGARMGSGDDADAVMFPPLEGCYRAVPLPAPMCTRAPSRRSSAGLTTTTLPSARPPVTSTQLPRSRPRVTVWYRTVESGPTVTTCGGPSRITSAVAGTRNGGVPAPSASCTWAYIPGRNTPVGLATRTSVSSVRAVASSAPAVRATRPRSVSPGSAGTVTTAGFPIVTAAALSSGTVTYTLSVSVCATVNRLPGALPVAAVSVPLTPPAVPTSAPASTLPAVITPANGPTTRWYHCNRRR